MNYKIIPTVFSIKTENFHDRFDKLVKISTDLHIDFMDGIFVPAQFLNLDLVPDLTKYEGEFEAHMMVKNPGKYMDSMKKKGFKKIIFHYESMQNNEEAIKLAQKIRKLKMKVFLAFNPETKPHVAFTFLKEFDGVMFMGVHPGKEHQSFLYAILANIQELRHFSKKIDIQVDGGVNTSNINYIARSGANIFNSGSFISESSDPKEAIAQLKKGLKG